MKLDLRDDHVFVVLSRRNLFALLHKLEMPGSARTLLCGDNPIDGKPTSDVVLVVHAEDDEPHYATRIAPPGPMHPATECALDAERVQRVGRAAARSRSNDGSEKLH